MCEQSGHDYQGEGEHNLETSKAIKKTKSSNPMARQFATNVDPGRSSAIDKNLRVGIVSVRVKIVNGRDKGKRAIRLRCCLGSRLQDVEAAVSEIQKSLKRTREESQNSPSGFSERQKSTGDNSYAQVSGTATPDSTSGPLFTRPLGRLVEVQGSIPGTRYFGPTSLDCLMLEFGDFITQHISLDTHEWRVAGALLHERIHSFAGCTERKLLNDTVSRPTRPPLAILDALIDPYFANINPSFPIWNKDEFRKMVDILRHSTCPDFQWASIVCCNNLILLTLNADSLCSVQQKMAHSGVSENASSLDCDLVAGFLANAKCAVENLGVVLPCLINLQALLSLCVVAQEHLQLHTLVYLFTQTMHCAEAIGVFQWRRYRSQLTKSKCQEYRNMAHCLYILDKKICWMAGVSPRIAASEVQLDLTTQDKSFERLTAQTELAGILETIYLDLYSSQVGPRTEDQVRQVVAPIWQRLEDWLAKSVVDLDATKSQPGSHPEQAVLLFQTLCAKLLLISPYKEHPDAMFQQRSSIAEMCMRILLALWTSALDPSRHISVPRLVLSWPPLCLLETCESLIKDTSSDSGEDLMLGFANLLSAMTGSGQEMSYSKRLYELSSILMATVEAAKAVGKRQKTTPSPDYLSPPAIRYHDFDMDGHRESGQAETPVGGRRMALYAGNAGQGDHFEALEFVGFSDWDDCGAGALITPTSFGNNTNDYCHQVDPDASIRGGVAAWVP
ncbi:hypothetical protein E4U55_004669 [Claviceps digitariae]|nr:hypothetical protein E4U55_004669 [Claviceps digitariae]